jgi:IS5 family transposase
MLRDAYEINKFFIGIQELMSEMDTQLAHIDQILGDDELYQMVRRDLEQRHPLTQWTGRPSTPVEVILRMLVVKHLYGLSYEKTEQYVKDSLVLRRFCRVYLEAVPDHSTLNKWALTIRSETLQALNVRVVKLATELRVTSGRKLRTDGTVVETHIHYPTDSSLLVDSVRVLSRTLKRAQQVLGEASELAKETFRDRTRSARRAARQIGSAARRGSQATRKTYRRLVDTTQASIRQAQVVLETLKKETSAQAAKLRDTLQTFIPRARQVIDQTVHRVFAGEKVPAQDKVVSIFESHTDIIKRGKANKETEFGHKVWLDEVEGGIITGYRVLQGNPSDQDQWQPSLDHHVQLFSRPPRLASADRGVWSPDNEQYATNLGVKRVILPQRGDKSDDRKRYEKQAWFRRGRCWHAGVEGRISVTKRKHRLDRCLNQGEDGFQRWVGWGVIANNLTLMGRKLAQV